MCVALEKELLKAKTQQSIRGSSWAPFLLEILGEAIRPQHEWEDVQNGVADKIKNEECHQKSPAPLFDHPFEAFFFTKYIGFMDPLRHEPAFFNLLIYNGIFGHSGAFYTLALPKGSLSGLQRRF